MTEVIVKPATRGRKKKTEVSQEENVIVADPFPAQPPALSKTVKLKSGLVVVHH